MKDIVSVEGTAARLRREFDLTFALPPAQSVAELEDLLAIRVAGDPYAVRLGEISGMMAGRTVVPVPARAPGLLGLAGIRGSVVPVFGLSSILGYTQASGEPRWLILCGSDDPVALAFPDFEGFLRLPKSSLHGDPSLRAARPHVREIASTERGARAVIGVPLVVAALRNRTGHRPAKEP